jgi:hypothetical protein
MVLLYHPIKKERRYLYVVSRYLRCFYYLLIA